MSAKKTLHLPALYLLIKYLSTTFAVPAMGGEFITLLYSWTFLNLVPLTVHPYLHELYRSHFKNTVCFK